MIGDYFIFILNSEMGRLEDLLKEKAVWEEIKREVEYLIIPLNIVMIGDYFIFISNSGMKHLEKLSAEKKKLETELYIYICMSFNHEEQ